MACGTTYRGCADLPVLDSAMANVSDIAFADGASGITVSWTMGALTGNVALSIAMIASPYTRTDYALVAGSTESELISITDIGVYLLGVRREDGGLHSPWLTSREYFLKGATGDMIVHNSVPIWHGTEIVMHTKIEKGIMLEIGDNILTEVASANLYME